MVNFAVIVETVETTGSGKKHKSTQTMQATSYKDAYALAKVLNQTSNHEHQRKAIVNFIISTRQGNSYFPVEELEEISEYLIEVTKAMQADPGPIKKSLTHTY